jgi:glyoxylase-like metal-dependent hydrolase (beta-lactamase superfamily II)
MADPQKKLPDNAPGDFFVDSTCINCGNCRELAPASFGDSGPFAFVKTQPRYEDEHRRALRALLARPTASIGGPPGAAAPVTGDFPIPVEADAAAAPAAEMKINGADPVSPAPGFTVIPTPGHTRGRCVLLLEMKGGSSKP